MKMLKQICVIILYLIGFIIYVFCLSQFNKISDQAWLLGIIEAVGIVIFMVAIMINHYNK